MQEHILHGLINLASAREIDQAIVSEDYKLAWPTQYCEIHKGTISDHEVLILKLLCHDKPNKPFHVSLSWLKHPKHVTLVEQVWNEMIIGMTMFKLMTKLKNTTKSWCRTQPPISLMMIHVPKQGHYRYNN